MSFSLVKGCHHMQLISYFNRLQRGQYMARSRFHTSPCLHSDWIDQQRQAMRMQEDRKSQMVARREKEKLEEVRIQEEQEEAMRNEIRTREKSMSKDKLDEAYFKDKKRFNIKDRRDPIHSGSKEDDGGEGCLEILYFSEYEGVARNVAQYQENCEEQEMLRSLREK
eukprot:GFUD01138003.1.p1 GENE.GFUD01138003.1~~GFUD01138003.1.p1  ORF type:complete len:167 (-),score=41.30 GFUD01138003.1:48-548(-)